MKQTGAALFVKRAFDKSVALATLVATAPVVACAAIAVRATMGAPVLFTQTRPGRDARPFRIYKMRTMREALDQRGVPLADEARLTKLGRFLRATSIDELPQLYNVLRGELSLVGPRPLLVEYLPRYSRRQARRHEVLPGITGWAQIHGRNRITWEEKLALDVWYVENWSPWLDVRVLAATVRAVLAREGISGEGHATMTPFMGSSKDVAPS